MRKMQLQKSLAGECDLRERLQLYLHVPSHFLPQVPLVHSLLLSFLKLVLQSTKYCKQRSQLGNKIADNKHR